MIYDYLFDRYDLPFESELHLRLIKTWTRLKLFGSLQVVIRIMNDKLQEAEEGNTQTTKQVL